MKRLTDILQAQGLSEDQINNISKAMKDGKVYIAGEENLDVRYGKAKQDLAAALERETESTKLIEQLQKDNKGNEALQKSMSDYQARIATIEAQRNQERLTYAIKLALMGEKALDVEYLAYKAMEKHPEWKEHPEDALDESGKVKGVDDLLAGLKTQHPTQFESVVSQRQVEPQRLPDQQGDPQRGVTRSDILKKSYADRAKLYADNPDAYNAAMQN